MLASDPIAAPAPSGDRPSQVPIGRQLAEARLRHRERRIGQVIYELRVRADAHAARGEAVPRPLSQALEGFATELAEARRALAGNDSYARHTRAVIGRAESS